MSTPNAPENATSIGESLSSLFHKTVQCMRRSHHFHGHAEHAQMRVLVILYHKGQTTQRELQQFLDIRSTSLSEILKKLENRGLIARNQNENDKRSVIVSLTDQGLAKANSVATSRHQTIDALFAPLSAMECAQLASILRKVIESYEMHAADSPLRHCHGGDCCMHGCEHQHKEY